MELKVRPSNQNIVGLQCRAIGQAALPGCCRDIHLPGTVGSPGLPPAILAPGSINDPSANTATQPKLSLCQVRTSRRGLTIIMGQHGEIA